MREHGFDTVVPTRYWHELGDGRIQCDVCPRACRLHEGQRGLCFVRARQDDQIVLTTYGRSSGFCIDPIEKKPLNHFLPGSAVLSFGTAGCNLACKFCFEPDTLIATTRGLRRIADLFDACEEKVAHHGGEVGFPASLEVWTRAGNRAPVAKVFAHPYSGELLSLKASCCPPILLTPNHKVFAAHRSNLTDVRPVAADKLSTEHYLVIPKRQPGAGARISFEAQGQVEAERAAWRDMGANFLVPLRRIERVPYAGTVYNLEVDDPDHSYLAPFIAVSNCQNWDISKSREMDTLADTALPEGIARAARQLGCRSVAFTYNDPVIFMEYAIDIAQACRAIGIKTVAVTAGYICEEPREEFYRHMDAANVDLKGFTERFYHQVCGGHLQPVLETLVYLQRHTNVWFEITNLLIPGENDSAQELEAMTQWVVEQLGPDVPLHFTAFHPDWKMRDRPPTPPATLSMARRIALKNGVLYAYTGNVHDTEGGSTYCAGCGGCVMGRDWFTLIDWNLSPEGRCRSCGAACAGVFDGPPERWGARRMPVRLAEFPA